jgi:F-type H+-transporting ATPase subunit delta
MEPRDGGELWLTHNVAVSGGFAVVQPKSALSINAVEGYPLEDFSADAVRAQISEAQKVVSGGGSEQDIAEAKIELEVSFASGKPSRQLLTGYRSSRACRLT